MNAVGEIQAAIGTLERLKAKAEPGRWDHQPYGGQNQNGDYAGGNIFDGNGEYLISEVSDMAGALIVTLHRTIDAQLAVLRAGRTAATGFPAVKDDFDLPGWAAEAKALALPLARAINGGN